MNDTPARTRNFKTWRPRFDNDRAVRQGEVMRLAIDKLGAGPAIAFMNDFHPDLSARPMDLAGESPNGSIIVSAWLTDRGAELARQGTTGCGASDD